MKYKRVCDSVEEDQTNSLMQSEVCVYPLIILLQCILGKQWSHWRYFILKRTFTLKLWQSDIRLMDWRGEITSWNLFSLGNWASSQTQSAVQTGAASCRGPSHPSHRKYWPPRCFTCAEDITRGPTSCYYNTQSFTRPPRSSPTLQHCCDITSPTLLLTDDEQGARESMPEVSQEFMELFLASLLQHSKLHMWNQPTN